MRGKRKIGWKLRVKRIGNHRERRFQALADRYHYYHQLCEEQRSYEQIISILSEEFYLSADYIARRLPDYAHLAKPTLQELRRQYPHLNWK